MTNGSGDWDNPPLGKNYAVEGRGAYELEMGALHRLELAS